MTDNKYEYEFLDPEQDTALIKLHENVLGENDEKRDSPSNPIIFAKVFRLYPYLTLYLFLIP